MDNDLKIIFIQVFFLDFCEAPYLFLFYLFISLLFIGHGIIPYCMWYFIVLMFLELLEVFDYLMPYFFSKS